MRAVKCVRALAAGLLFAGSMAGAATQASAQEPPRTSDKPAIVLPVRGVSCANEATRRNLRDAPRAAYVADCRKQRVSLRNQRRSECRTEASGKKRLWGLARHKFIDNCMRQRALAQPASIDPASVKDNPAPANN